MYDIMISDCGHLAGGILEAFSPISSTINAICLTTETEVLGSIGIRNARLSIKTICRYHVE